MGEHTKHSTSRVELRERIILAAVELFTTNGIKSITMDEIAASLGISKRTLYEVFPDKETLLEECILKSQKDGDIFVKGVIETSSNVLEVLLRCYQWSIERFHLGIVLLVNPFRAAKAAIMFFGISILADGLFELITYIQQRRAEKSEYKDIR